jgi:hypothetical protein
MLADETELLKSLVHGMTRADLEDCVRAMNEAPPEKPAGRRRRRSSRPAISLLRLRLPGSSA